MSLTQRILDEMASMEHDPDGLQPKRIYERMNEEDRPKVGNKLTTMRNKGLVDNPSRGRYQLLDADETDAEVTESDENDSEELPTYSPSEKLSEEYVTDMLWSMAETLNIRATDLETARKIFELQLTIEDDKS